MKVLLCQLAPTPGDPTANAERAAALLAAHADADLAVFPELYLSGYELMPTLELARRSASALALLASQASRCATAVAMGFAEERPGGVANAVVLLGKDGLPAGIYRKTHLFGGEQRGYLAGDRLLVARVADRLVAPLICFDVEFPEPARAVARAGAELLVIVSANMEPYGADHDLMARARALENRLPLVYVNRVGSESGFRFVGGSRVIGSNGTVIAQLSEDAEETRLVDVPEWPVEDVVDYLSQFAGELPVERPDLIPSGVGGTA